MKTNIPENIELAVRSVIGCDVCWRQAWTKSKARPAVMVRDLTTWAIAQTCLTVAETAARVGSDPGSTRRALRRFEQDCKADKLLARWREGVKELTEGTAKAFSKANSVKTAETKQNPSERKINP